MFFGSGILRGMWITLKNFFYSYSKGPEHMNGMFTTQYPEQRLPEKERFRNFPFLVYDDKPEDPRCVACDICAKECPPKCIYIVREFDKDGKPLKKPAVFDIDFTVCMNCGICEEACPFEAIYMDHEFEIASPTRNKTLLYHRDDLLKPNEYFHKIRPNDATVVDKKLADAAAKKKAAEEAAKAAAAAKAAQAAQAPAPQPPAPPQNPPAQG